MFPIPFNFPFRKKDGSLTTIGKMFEDAGGGSSYTLPTASAEIKGGVKIGEGLTMDGETLKNTNPTPATPYTLPTASSEVLGGVKVGTNLSIDENGVLSASGGGGTMPHCFIVSTNKDECKKILVLTTVDTITDKASLADALVHGRGIVLKNPDNVDYIGAEVSAFANGNLSVSICHFTIDGSAIKTSWASSGISSYTVSDIVKIY